VARYGGEEFVAVLPDCTKTDARAVAERIRSELAAALRHAAVPTFTVTIGLADGNPGDTLADVVASADTAMLSAKSLGRDRVLAAGDLDEGPTPDETTATSPLPMSSSTSSTARLRSLGDLSLGEAVTTQSPPY
jgi:hypothetical protein